MSGFLDKLADELLDTGAVHRKTVVFPNRRPALFLEKKLAEKAGKPVIAPEIFSVTDFFARLTGKKISEKYELLLVLFESYTEITRQAGLKTQAFEQFIGWGHILLNDFDEIDKFLISPGTILNALKHVKEIEQWDLDAGREAVQMNDYLQFFGLLPEIYKRFREKLSALGMAYDGMIYREAVDRYEQWKHNFTGDSLFLAGFNALTKAEETVFKNSVRDGIARMYWDADEFYLDEPFEAGVFLRKYKNDPILGRDFKWIFNGFRPPKSFYTVHATDEVSQVQFTVKKLLEFENARPENKSDFRLKTLIVLNDAKMLNELINALPEKLEQVNLTFSMPAVHMQSGKFLELYIRFYTDTERSGNVNLKDFLYLLKHPFFKPLSGEDLQNMEAELLKQHSKFIDKSRFFEWIRRKGLDIYFPDIQTPAELLDMLPEIILKMSGNISRNHPERSALPELSGLTERLADMERKFNLFPHLLSVLKFYKKLVKELFVRFSGHPLQGYQIMGLLETRVLDFDRVFMLGMNEGILPQGKGINSFVPYDIRKRFGLPVYDDKNAVSAYHTYRLFSRAKQVWMIYDASATGLSSGEPSRYILQLKEKLPARGIEVQDIYLSGSARVVPPVKELRKDTAFVNRIMEVFTKKGVSASMILSYKHYPADFFRRYILDWKEKEELEDFIAVRRMGEVIHYTMEHLYKPYLKQILSKDIINELIEKSPALTERFFYEKYLNLPGGKTVKLKGKNILALESAKEMVKKFLRIDLNYLQQGNELVIEAGEQHVEFEKEVPGIGNVKFKGIIDRLDRLNGQLRVVDYKTGKVEKPFSLKNQDAWEDYIDKTLNSNQKKYWFQVYFYLWLMYHSGYTKDANELMPAIYTVRNSDALVHPKIENTEVFLDAFETLMFSVLREMADIDMPLLLEKEK
jgi:hypothetical protein